MNCLVKLLAVFAILLTIEAAALCQSPTLPPSQTQAEKLEPKPAKELSSEDGPLEPAKKLKDALTSITGVPVQFIKETVEPDKDTDVLAFGRGNQSPTQLSHPAQSQAPQALQQQPTAKPTLIVRNVWIVSEPDKTLQKADVLIVDGKLARVEATSPVPSDAMVLDGGGAVLTLQADGSIKLTQNTASNSPDSTSAKNGATDPANFKTASLEIPDGPTARHARVAPPAQPAENNPAQQPQPAGNLAQEVTDPTAPLTTITFQNRYVPSLWGIDDHLNEFSVQVVLPYKLGGRAQILRAVIPYLTDTPSPENRGIGDVALANITMFPQEWGTFAIGPLVSLGTNKGPGVDTFAVGPAVGAITKRGKFLFGFLNQNLFSFGGDIKITQIQPIVSYTLNQKVSFAIGDAQTTIDWNKRKFVSVPLSFQVNYIAMLGKQPIRLFVNPQYSPINEFGQRKWTIGGGFALLLR